MDAIEVRPAGMADVAAMARVYAAAEGAIRVALGAPPVVLDPTLEQWLAQRLTASVSPRDAMLVAERSGKILGLAQTGAPADLHAIYVAPEAWGSGVAEVLHDRAVGHLRECGVAVATLSVIARNGRARRFYERGGWVLAGDDGSREFGGVELAFVRYTRAL